MGQQLQGILSEQAEATVFHEFEIPPYYGDEIYQIIFNEASDNYIQYVYSDSGQFPFVGQGDPAGSYFTGAPEALDLGTDVQYDTVISSDYENTNFYESGIGAIWPYKDIRFELGFMYLKNAESGADSTQATAEVFFFDGLGAKLNEPTSDVDISDSNLHPCWYDEPGDGESPGDQDCWRPDGGLSDYTVFFYSWCNNEEWNDDATGWGRDCDFKGDAYFSFGPCQNDSISKIPYVGNFLYDDVTSITDNNRGNFYECIIHDSNFIEGHTEMFTDFCFQPGFEYFDCPETWTRGSNRPIFYQFGVNDITRFDVDGSIDLTSINWNTWLNWTDTTPLSGTTGTDADPGDFTYGGVVDTSLDLWTKRVNDDLTVNDLIGTDYEDIASDVINQKDLYFHVRLGAQDDEPGDVDHRNFYYYRFTVPAPALKPLLTGQQDAIDFVYSQNSSHCEDHEYFYDITRPDDPDVEIVYIEAGSSSDDYGDNDEIGWEKRDPVWRMDCFRVRFFAPTFAAANGVPYYPDGAEISNSDNSALTYLNWEVNSNLVFGPWFNVIDNIQFNRAIDYISYNWLTDGDMIGMSQIQNIEFRPISNLYLEYIGNYFTAQRYYDILNPAKDVVTPYSEVMLDFNISKEFDNISLLTEVDWVNGVHNHTDTGNTIPLKYAYKVLDWGDDDFIAWDNTAWGAALDNSSGYGDSWKYVRDGENNKITTSHIYYSAGYKSIKVVVAALLDHPSEDPPQNTWMQLLKFYVVDIVCYLNEPSFMVDEFGELGGYNYLYIPWNTPGQTPIIGGISSDSRYVKSLRDVAEAGQFLPHERVQYSALMSNLDNNELGDYIGKADISQTRGFITGAFDMNNLLKLEDPTFYSDLLEGDLTQKTDIEQTYVDNIPYLRDDCLFEFNFGETEYNSVRDSSGNGNKGIMIGDYSLQKPNKTTPIQRDSFMDTPGKGDDDKAI